MTLIKSSQVLGLKKAYADIITLKKDALITQKILNFIKEKNENIVFPNDLQIKEFSEDAEKEMQEGNKDYITM